MRKTIFTLGLMLAAALSLTNCTKNEETNFTPEVKTPFELYANLESRTTNDGMETKWADGDKINVFHAVAGTTEYVHDTPYDEVAKVGNPFVTDASGLFKGTLAQELDQTKSYDWYACYPYTSFAETPANTSNGYVYIGGRSDTPQLQNGNSNMAHIAGTNYPLYGIAKDIPASEKPAITMSHAASLVKFNVTNTLDEEITVTSIKFIVHGEEQIVGNFFMAFDQGTPKFTNATYTSNEATLNVQNGTPIAKGESAQFYMGIKPFFSDEFDMDVIVDAKSATGVGTCSKELGAVTTTFYPGKIKTINLSFDAAMEVPTEMTATIDFSKAEQRTAFSTTEQVWSNAGITLTNTKGSSTSNIADYTNPARFYKSSKVEITSSVGNMTKIAFVCNTAAYATSLNKSITGSTVSGSTVTVTFAEPTNSFSCSMTDGQVRMNSLTVTYTPADESAPFIGLDKTSLDVDAAATSEELAVTLKNINESDVTVNSSATWVVADLAEGVLTLNIAENTDTAARTATVTISASDISETITINQEGAAKTTTIDMITVAGNYSIANAWVVATYAQGCLITDSSNKYILCYMGYNATNIPAVGTVVNVEGAVSEYGGLLQFGADSVITATGEKKTVDHGTVTEMSGADLDAYLTKPVVKYASFEGTLNISNSKYYNVTVSGTSTAIGSISYPTAEVVTQLTALNGKGIKATGYLIGISSGKYTNMMVTSVEATGTTPEPEPEPEPEPTDGAYTLLTDVGELVAGDKIVIAAKDSNYALSTNQKSNNRGQAAITKNSNNTITFDSDVQILTVQEGKTAGTFALYTGSGYLYAASSSSNHLKTETTLSSNSSWSISIANGTTTIKATGDFTRNVMQYNQTSSLFACYSSASQKPIVIYRLK